MGLGLYFHSTRINFIDFHSLIYLQFRSAVLNEQQFCLSLAIEIIIELNASVRDNDVAKPKDKQNEVKKIETLATTNET